MRRTDALRSCQASWAIRVLRIRSVPELAQMPGFRYQAYNLEGKLHKGVLEADSARQARAPLRDQGLTPYRVEVIAANDPPRGARLRPVSLSGAAGHAAHARPRLAARGRAHRRAGLQRADRAGRERARAPGAGGAARRGARGQHRRQGAGVLPARLPRALPHAGRRGRVLGAAAARALAPRRLPRGARSSCARACRSRSSIPAIVMCVALGVVGALLVYVLPQVMQVFQHAHQQLPILTRALIALSGFLQATWIAVDRRCIAAAVVALRLALQRARLARAHPSLRSGARPSSGRVLRHLDAARLAATLSILVGSRVPILAGARGRHRRDDARADARCARHRGARRARRHAARARAGRHRRPSRR